MVPYTIGDRIRGGTVFLVSTHTNDASNRRLDTYRYYMIRYIHIPGARIEVEGLGQTVFYPLLAGKAIVSDGTGNGWLDLIGDNNGMSNNVPEGFRFDEARSRPRHP